MLGKTAGEAAGPHGPLVVLGLIPVKSNDAINLKVLKYVSGKLPIVSRS